MMYSKTALALAVMVTCVAGMALPGFGSGNNFVRLPGNGVSGGTPGRVLTKTYTYDSTKDLDDPCNPVTGDPERCLRSMEPLAEIHPAPYASEHDVVAEGELAFAKDVAQNSGADFDYVYQREPRKKTATTVPSASNEQAPNGQSQSS